MNNSRKVGVVWLACFLIGLLVFAIGGVFSFYLVSLIGFLIFGVGFGFLLGFAFSKKYS